jgi:hypothetical protein
MTYPAQHDFTGWKYGDRQKDGRKIESKNNKRVRFTQNQYSLLLNVPPLEKDEIDLIILLLY